MLNRVQRVPQRTEPSRVSRAVRYRPTQRHLELPDCTSHPHQCLASCERRQPARAKHGSCFKSGDGDYHGFDL